MGGDGSGDFIGALGGYGDAEVEEFVDPALLLGGGVGEVLGCLVCQVVELGETGTAGAALGVPGGDLGEVALECDLFVADFSEGGGELGVVDLFAGVGSDDAGLFEVELVEALGDGGPLAGAERRIGEGLGNVVLGGLSDDPAQAAGWENRIRAGELGQQPLINPID